MRACLTHPLGGYYMNQKPVFGSKGDFITSPEISQMFGELLGIWFITQMQDASKKYKIVELGPGRGTLISDMLRTFQQIKGISEKIQACHLVEASPELQAIQAQTLHIKDVQLLEERNKKGKTPEGVDVFWHEHFQEIPQDDSPLLLVAHEFFDALPIYKFQKTNQGWREILVDVNKE